MTDAFTIGQRWISDTESDLGLGTILEVEFRQITVVFLATGDTRIYAKETAPLTRVVFAAGDSITSHEGWLMTVETVVDNDGLLTYDGHRSDTGEKTVLEEAGLDNFLQFRSPRDRLFAGLVDGTRWYALRRQVFEHRHQLSTSPARGLMGARMSILPHQIYIAVEAMQRHHPRLLLADEVGLGKTIEAGLIVHAKLTTLQISRVLIVVPEALLHQWLVEMLRKFNLAFRIMDDERFNELAPGAPDENPFLAEQLVLCSLETLLNDEQIGDAALTAGWDMLVADEAHHLSWEPDNPSPAYTLVEELSQQSPSVLLLTATPEQLGQAGHFARLRLLDPDRFSSLEQYLDEEARYSWVADVADRLNRDEALTTEQIGDLEELLGEPIEAASKKTLSSSAALSMSELGKQLMDKLVDRHGTGRLMFRNTRSAISGFPKRHMLSHTLNDPSLESVAAWLIEFLAEQYPNKVLLICSKRETVQILAETLRVAGIQSAQFHEDMKIVERDRAAAWFSNPEEDCRLMLCSEIGSEGRNFQFLHQLVTIELPMSPDLLEQRIGRLDRIGQDHDIEIHVPSAPGSADQLLSRWYQDGLNAFEETCPSGSAVIEKLGAELEVLVGNASKDGAADSNTAAALELLIKNTQLLSSKLNTDMEAGRDRLLELNSNRPERIQEHLDALARRDRDYRLQDFMEAVFDRFGVEMNEQRDHAILHPSDHMQVEHFPHLTPSGLTVTFDRATALTREDFTFLSWDHPMVTAAMDLILDEGFGQADTQVVKLEELPKGLAFVEASYILQCTGPAFLNIERHLPDNLQTFHVGLDNKNYSEILHDIDLDSLKQRYDRNALKQVIQKHRDSLEKLLDVTVTLAENTLPPLIEEARASIEQECEQETERLVALAKVNTSVSQDEIDILDQEKRALLKTLDTAHVRPVGVRVLFNAS
ncbi:MAG: RNA polymerase-associated protein RapA [Granulosicoccus sp.]